MDNFGLGIGISSDRTKLKNGSTEDIESSNLGSFHAMYGHSFGNNFNIYGKAAVSAGLDRSKYDYTGYSGDTKYKEFGLNFEVGTPFPCKKNPGFLFTPYMAYDYGMSKDDNYHDATSSFNLGTRLNYSLPCSSFAHNCSQSEAFAANMYTQGRNVIGGSTFLSLKFGAENDKYVGGISEGNSSNKYSNSGASINADYYHYFLNNMAIGGELKLDSWNSKNKDNNNKQNDFSWMIMPELLVNLPVTGAMHNSFAFVGYGFGMEKQKSTYTSQSNETKYNKSEVSFGLGYNMFIAKGFALTPVIDYCMASKKDTDTKLKSKSNGPELSFALRYFW
jgi:hypothetical protein